MKKSIFRGIAAVMVLVLCLGSLAACAGGGKPAETTSGQASQAGSEVSTVTTTVTTETTSASAQGSSSNQAGSDSQEYRLVKDQTGREVKVPLDPKRVVITFWPMGSAYTLFQGSAETIVGKVALESKCWLQTKNKGELDGGGHCGSRSLS